MQKNFVQRHILFFSIIVFCFLVVPFIRNVYAQEQAEKKEQAELRKEYIATIKMNLRNQLDNIDVKEADGTVVNLGERYGRKKTH